MESCYLTYSRDTHRLVQEAGLPVECFPDEKSLHLLAKAGTVVVDSFDYKLHPFHHLTPGARVVQLWHGVGFKKIGLVEKESKTSGKFSKQELEFLYSGYDTVITTSAFYEREVFKKSFNATHFEILGYPRNDALFQWATKDSMINCDFNTFNKTTRLRKEGRKTILYTPTFRDQIGSPTPGLDFNRLHAFLDAQGFHLVIKTHRLTRIPPTTELPYISFYDSACDVYPFMRLADVMVTDYSSIYMDYLLLDRPVIFYCPDYDEYVACNRELQFPYDDMTPGPKCHNQDEFEAALKQAAYNDDGWGEARQAMCAKAFQDRDGNASQRIADHLVGPSA